MANRANSVSEISNNYFENKLAYSRLLACSRCSRAEFVQMQKAYLGGMRLERLHIFVPEFSEERALPSPAQRAIPHRPLELNPGHLRLVSSLGLLAHESRERETYFPTWERYVSDMRLAFLASVTLHLVCVQAIDSNANNLVSRHSTCTCRDQNICPRCFFSRVSSSREILSRATAGASHTSVGAMRATSKSPYIVNSSIPHDGSTPAYRQTVSARHRE